MKKRNNKEKNQDKKPYKSIFKMIFFVLTAIILLIGIVLFLNIRKLGIFITNNPIHIKYDTYVDINYSKDSITESYKNEVLIYEKGLLSTVNSSGKVTWSCEISNLNAPILKIKNNYFIIVDKNSGIYYLFKNKKLILEGKCTSQIKQVALAKDGKFAFEISDKGYKTFIILYDKKGNIINNYYLMSDMITNLNIIDKEKTISYVDVKLNGNNVNSSFVCINYLNSNLELKENVKLENETIYNYEIYYPYVIIRTEKNIYKYNLLLGSLNNIKNIEDNQINFSEVGKDTEFYIKKTLDNNNQKQTIINIINNLFNYEKNINIEYEPLLLKKSNGILVTSSEKSIVAYNYLGTKLKEWNSNAIISKFRIFNNGNSIATIIANKLYIINL